MKYVIANWKMNMDKGSIDKWFELFAKQYTGTESVEAIISGSYIHLNQLSELIKKYNLKIELAAQDISVEDKGAHTGEVGGFQIKEFCKYVLVGHSERKEPRNLVLQKRDAAIKVGLIPIVCFVTQEQLEETYHPEALLAWEDPSNISKNGTYFEKDPKEIEIAFEKYMSVKPEAKIIYGGSVNRQNVQNLVRIPNVNGILPGNASLDPEHYNDLIKAFQ